MLFGKEEEIAFQEAIQSSSSSAAVENHIIPKKIRSSFSIDEDKILCEHMALNPNDNWKTVALLFRNRTARQCRDRWLKNLSNHVKRGKVWTFEEEVELLKKVEEFGTDYENCWDKIHFFFPERSEIELRNKWHEVRKPNKFISFMNEQPETLEAPSEIFEEEETEKTIINNLQPAQPVSPEKKKSIVENTPVKEVTPLAQNSMLNINEIMDKYVLPSFSCFEFSIDNQEAPYFFDFGF